MLEQLTNDAQRYGVLPAVKLKNFSAEPNNKSIFIYGRSQ
jgi:hypothetical protein